MAIHPRSPMALVSGAVLLSGLVATAPALAKEERPLRAASPQQRPLAASPEAAPQLLTRQRGGLMGTVFRVRAFVSTPTQEAAINRVFDRIAELEKLWSPWIEQSDLWRINKHGHQTAVTVSPLTLALLERSKAMCERTDRAFDPTFFALSPLYDFRQPPFSPPAASRIAALLPLVDCRKIRIDADAGHVALTTQGTRLHLGGNAKGTALDIGAALLRNAGIQRFLIDGGGDVIASGDGPEGPWRVGIQHPRLEHSLAGVIEISGGAVATSGDYERYAIVDGRRYHHIVDPRTGSVARGCMSATVITPPGPHAGEIADAWATTLCVLGPERGFTLLRKDNGPEALVYTTDGRAHKTTGFRGQLEAQLQLRADEIEF